MLEEEHAVEHALDERRRRRADAHDLLNVGRVDRGRGALGLLQRRLGRGQVAVRLGLLRRDLRRLLVGRVGDRVRLLLLFFRDGRLFRDGLQQLLDLPRLDLHLLVHDLELLLELVHVLLRLLHLLQPRVDGAGQAHHVLPLGGVQVLVPVHERQVRLGRHVDVAPEPLEVLGAGLGDADVHAAHHALQRPLDLVVAGHREVADELAGHGHERVLGPRHEPVDGAAVDEPRELLRAAAELHAHRREAQHDVEVLAHAVDEEVPQIIGRVGRVRRHLLHHRAYVGHDGLHLVLREEPGHLARHQHLVDVLEERLALHLGVREEEAHLAALEARRLVQVLQVVEQVVLAVGLGDGDLERERPADVRRHARQALLARPAHAHQQPVAARHGQQPRDAHQVHERVVEVHQLHLETPGRLVELPLLLLHALADLLQPPAHRLVVRGVRVEDLSRLGILHGLTEPVDEVDRLLDLRHLLGRGPEGLHGQLGDLVLGPGLVVGVDELVHEHALALVLPEREEVAAGRGDGAAAEGHDALRRLSPEPLGGGQDDPLEDLGQLADVEEVVELGGRGEHLARDGVPQRDGHGHQAARHLGHRRVERAGVKPARHEGAEDVVDGGARGRRDVDDGELPLEAVGHVVFAPAGRVHGREVPQALDLLEVADGLLQLVEPVLLQQLPHELVRDLVAPLVHLGHRDVIDEHHHLLAAGRAEDAARILLE